MFLRGVHNATLTKLAICASCQLMFPTSVYQICQRVEGLPLIKVVLARGYLALICNILVET